MFCHKCGTVLDEGMIFCPVCGAEQKNEDNLSNNSNGPTIEERDGFATNSNGKSKDKNKKILGAIIGGTVVCILAFAVGVIGYWYQDDQENGKNTYIGKTVSDNDNIQDYISQSETYMQAGNYKEALAILDTAEQTLGEQNKIEKQRKKVQKSQLLDTLQSLEEKEDYASAILFIRDSSSWLQDDKDVIEKLNSLKATYKEKAITEAEETLATLGYAEAIKIVNEALVVLPEDEELLKKAEEYAEYRPVSLQELKVTNSNDGHEFCDSETDPRGESNRNVLVLESYVEFYVGGKYKKLVTTLDPASDFSTLPRAEFQLEVYADDEIAYTSPVITYKTNNIEVEADIANAEYIRLQVVYVGSGNNMWLNGGILVVDGKVLK